MAHHLHCAHHVPGRLRLKVSSIKGHPQRARSLENWLLALDGVYSATANPLTGSIVVTYDVAGLSASMILARLEMAGCALVGEAQYGRPQLAKVGVSLGDRLLDKILDVALERSATALISALI